MVIYHADCLHIGIYDRTAYELKTTFFQISVDLLSESGSFGWETSSEWLVMGFLIHIGPYKCIKAAILYPDGGGVFLYTKECKGRFFG